MKEEKSFETLYLTVCQFDNECMQGLAPSNASIENIYKKQTL